jgi:hypothetical protein
VTLTTPPAVSKRLVPRLASTTLKAAIDLNQGAWFFAATALTTFSSSAIRQRR